MHPILSFAEIRNDIHKKNFKLRINFASETFPVYIHCFISEQFRTVYRKEKSIPILSNCGKTI